MANATNSTSAYGYNSCNFTSGIIFGLDLPPAVNTSAPFYAVGLIQNLDDQISECCGGAPVAHFHSQNVDNNPDSCFTYCNITKEGLTSDEVSKCVLRVADSADIHGNWGLSQRTGPENGGGDKPSGAVRGKGMGGGVGYLLLGVAFAGAFVGLL